MATVWYIFQGGATIGPLTTAELQAMATSGQLAPESLVSCNGQPWIPATQLNWLSFPSQQPGVFVPAQQPGAFMPASLADEPQPEVPDLGPSPTKALGVPAITPRRGRRKKGDEAALLIMAGVGGAILLVVAIIIFMNASSSPLERAVEQERHSRSVPAKTTKPAKKSPPKSSAPKSSLREPRRDGPVVAQARS
jgi:hypothetical protein